jgi:hypothetical protein
MNFDLKVKLDLNQMQLIKINGDHVIKGKPRTRMYAPGFGAPSRGRGTGDSSNKDLRRGIILLLCWILDIHQKNGKLIMTPASRRGFVCWCAANVRIGSSMNYPHRVRRTTLAWPERST